MTKRYFETSTVHGAKFNLTIDISPEDCIGMCKELFNNLSLLDQSVIVNNWLKERDKHICTCSIDKSNPCTSCPTSSTKIN